LSSSSPERLGTASVAGHCGGSGRERRRALRLQAAMAVTVDASDADAGVGASSSAIGAGSSAGSAHGCCCANLYDVWRTTAGRILATGDAQEKTTSTTATTTTTTTANEGDEDPMKTARGADHWIERNPSRRFNIELVAWHFENFRHFEN